MGRTYYSTLEVTESASAETIRGAYRYLAQRWHPDKNPDNRAESERITKELNEAFDVLSDSVRRAQYDQWLASRRTPPKSDHAAVASESNEREPAVAPVSQVQKIGALQRTWLMFLFILAIGLLLIGLPYMVITEGFRWKYVPAVLLWLWVAHYSYRRLFGSYELQRWEAVIPAPSPSPSPKRLIRAGLLGGASGAVAFGIFAIVLGSGSPVLFGVDALIFFVVAGIFVGAWRFR